MRETRLIMGMPMTVATPSSDFAAAAGAVFEYFIEVDERFSTYKEGSEISQFNRGEISSGSLSEEMREVFDIAERVKRETNGYFDINRPDGSIDPSGVVKGWAIRNAAYLLESKECIDYCIDGAGDIASAGVNDAGESWSVGIRNPFNQEEVVKVIYPNGKGVATSGSYIRGAHIYNPFHPERPLEDIVSLTVIGGDVLEADCFATAAFAMGREGIGFIESRDGLEAYSIDANGIATMTSGFLSYLSL